MTLLIGNRNIYESEINTFSWKKNGCNPPECGNVKYIVYLSNKAFKKNRKNELFIYLKPLRLRNVESWKKCDDINSNDRLACIRKLGKHIVLGLHENYKKQSICKKAYLIVVDNGINFKMGPIKYDIHSKERYNILSELYEHYLISCKNILLDMQRKGQI